ncbi:Bax inhibitor-1/YccA family protein [Massilia genomosp. 1]|uniref:BAX inhibitor (BI)-1/YccA family protein n=1 Tax=Massilia genomosp. 1 TaxID=2609280 RepID=A0ABX0MSI2_9BURK|nr:Bax inhibitor-1/YccA family protein [Massilia genomosp. 1]NHZ63321.1 BAX inhibitor (BI)-1/YccA family protein [Massilia genomosp. 1]
MSISLQDYDLVGSQEVRHRVLRNTYWLLALSMIPTVLGAVLGVMFHIPVPRGIIGFVLFLAFAYGFIWGIEKTKESAMGVVVLLGFTFFMGIWLTPLLTRTLNFANGGTLIMLAFGGTASIFAVLASIATVSKRDFSMMGKWLFAGVMVLILATLANYFFQLPALWLAISVIAIAIFSAYILYDVQRIVNGGETNYISATLSLYLDVYMIFQHLLALLGMGGERE